MNSTINANSGAHTFTHGKTIKCSFNKNNVTTIKRKYNFNKGFITRARQIGTMMPM